MIDLFCNLVKSYTCTCVLCINVGSADHCYDSMFVPCPAFKLRLSSWRLLCYRHIFLQESISKVSTKQVYLIHCPCKDVFKYKIPPTKMCPTTMIVSPPKKKMVQFCHQVGSFYVKIKNIWTLFGILMLYKIFCMCT